MATADHLVPLSSGGKASKDNLIGLCKSCNSIVKSRKNVHSWYVQNYNVRYNLLKQMKVIDNMANSDEIIWGSLAGAKEGDYNNE